MAKDSDNQGDANMPKEEEPTEADNATTDDEEDEQETESVAEESEDGEDEEPKLKYARLTSYLGPVYRNGDATSAFLVAGDKMVCLVVLGKAHAVLIGHSLLALIMEILYVFPSKPLTFAPLIFSKACSTATVFSISTSLPCALCLDLQHIYISISSTSTKWTP